MLIATALAVAPIEGEKVSILGQSPRWNDLELFQRSLSREEFESKIRKIYSPDGSFFQYLDMTPEKAVLYRDIEKSTPLWTFYFAEKKNTPAFLPFHFSIKTLRELREASWDAPLKGLTICLDPGHIGGDWADDEERNFRIKKDPPIVEGNLNMITCRYLAQLLKKNGARVVWTKQDYQPVTSLRPADLEIEGIHFFQDVYQKPINYKRVSFLRDKIRLCRELLFYRAAEITARAEKINNELKPDMTICVHFNAARWRGRRPRLLSNVNRLILFVHGSYHRDELKYDNHKFALLKKMFEQTSHEEISAAEAIARQMHAVWGWQAQGYDSYFANRVSDNPYVYSRNLLANRLYNGPVVFVEGPFMNDKEIYPRLQAGDYDGEKMIGGKNQRSIFREYAEIIANGIIHHYMGIP
ncbi:MAG: N-acetylmuramoyl-L-alanine amidase [Verrucomicrobiota bacterium]